MNLLSTKKRRERKNFENEINLAVSSTLEKFGTANADFFKMNSELGKLNPDRGGAKGHKGFVFEHVEKAKRNAESRVQETGKNYDLTDNIGKVNDPESDLVQVTGSNSEVQRSGEQLKTYNQQTTKNSIRDVMNNKDGNINRYQRITVPSGRYDDTLAEIDNYIKKAEECGNEDGAKNLKELRKKIKKGNASEADISLAEQNKDIYTAKEVIQMSHKAGIESAKMGGTISAGLSAGKNAKALIDGERDVEEAIVDVTKDTAKGVAKSYATGATSSAIGGALKNSSNQICKNLAKKSGPTAILQTGVILAKQTGKLFSGQITPEQFAENIGQEGASLASSLTGANLGATVGTFIVPGVGTVIGGVVGGMVASMMSGALYHELKKTIQETKLSDEKRKMMEEFCQKLTEQEKEHRKQVMAVFNEFLDEKENEIRAGFNSMSLAIQNGESIDSGLHLLGDAFGLSTRFKNSDELQNHVASGKTLKI